MPLVPFKLFSDETRLIIHNDCLYKLKLTNKSDISSTEISSFQRDEMNTELTKVIRAILFLIKVEKMIPSKIYTPFFTVCVAIKFWKIALKLGFSKNGSRLKCGHLIELMLIMGESRVQNKEDSEVESNVRNENIQQFGHRGLRQFVIDSDNSESEGDSRGQVVTNCKSPEHSKSAPNEDSNIISTDTDGTKNKLVESSRIPDSLHNQPPDQSSVISDRTAPAQINPDSVQTFDKHLHLSAPPKETIHSDQVLSIFVSSCTQTDPDELDLYVNNPDPHSKNHSETACHSVYSDHNYLKSLNSVACQNVNKLAGSKSNNTSTQKSDPSNINNKESTVLNLNSSPPGHYNNNEDIASSVSDDNDVVFVSSGPAELVPVPVDKVKMENLNAEPEDTCLGSLSNESDTDCPDQNDVWGIESRPLEVVSEVEVPMESPSENSRDESMGKSKQKHHSSEETSNQYRERTSEKPHCVEQAVQEGNSSDTERTESSTEKLKSVQLKKQVKPKRKRSSTGSRRNERAKSLRPRIKVDNVLDRKSRSARKIAICPARQSSTRQGKKKMAKKTPEKKCLLSVDDTRKRSNQESGIPPVPTENTFGLHDRYKVQTQELQEDLKLQNLAHPSSPSTKRKQRSFLEYLNFSNFLRRSKRHK